MRSYCALLCAGVLAAVSISTANAAPHRFNVSIAFATGATGAGTLVYDSSTLAVTEYSVAVFANSPADSFTAVTYDTGAAFATSGANGSLAFPYIQLNLNGTSPARLLAFAPVAALDGATSPVAMQTTALGFATECFNCFPARAIASGSFIYVAPVTASTTTLTLAPPLVLGGSQTLTATVSGSNPNPGGSGPEGSIAFAMDGSPIAGCTAVSTAASQAQCTTTFPPGTHTFAAGYAGDADFATSSGTTSARVGPVATTTTLVAVPDTLPAAGPVVMTANVVESVGGAAVTTGTVSFTDNSVGVCGSVPVVAGVASCTFTASAGSHFLIAAYSGDTLFVPGAGNANVTVASVAASAPTPVPALAPLLLGLLSVMLAAVPAFAMRR
jgi:hypothetical protein